MNDTTILINYTVKALQLVLLLSMIPIAIATVIGIIISLLQALTQIQEQTLPFAIKLIVISIALLATSQWLGAEMYNFTYSIMENFPCLERF